MKISSQIRQASLPPRGPSPQNDPPEEPRDQVIFDRGGAAAAGVIGLVMAGGAHAFRSSPTLALGMNAFIGGVTGLRMAEDIGENKAIGLAAGAAVGAGIAAAGLKAGWPGALGVAAAAFVARGLAPNLLD